MLGGQAFQRFVHAHVGVKRIISRRCSLLAIGVINGGFKLYFVGQKAAGFNIGCHAILEEVVVATLADPFFETAKSVGFDMAGEIDACHIRQLHVERALRSPSALVAEILQAQFIGPYFHALDGTGIVSDTNHDGAHFSQRRISHHGNFVCRTVYIIFAIKLGIPRQAQ